MIRSPRLLSQAKLLHGWMIFEGGDGAPRLSGSSDGGVQTSLKRLLLTSSQLFAGICRISGSNSPEPT